MAFQDTYSDTSSVNDHTVSYKSIISQEKHCMVCHVFFANRQGTRNWFLCCTKHQFTDNLQASTNCKVWSNFPSKVRNSIMFSKHFNAYKCNKTQLHVIFLQPEEKEEKAIMPETPWQTTAQMFCHSIRHSIWHLLWHSMWRLFWHSMWLSIWHSTWHLAQLALAVEVRHCRRRRRRRRMKKAASSSSDKI